MASFNGVPVPANGQKIEYRDGKYTVPNHPIIPFIEGDGTGRDIWKASATSVRRRSRKGLPGQALGSVV